MGNDSVMSFGALGKCRTVFVLRRLSLYEKVKCEQCRYWGQYRLADIFIVTEWSC
jgi:hypothetical protein